MTIESIIRRDHGSAAILALGQEADQIIAEHQQLLDSGEYDNSLVTLYFGTSPDEAAAQEAYNHIRDKALHSWLSGIPRRQIIETLNTMVSIVGGATIEPLPGESLSAVSLSQLWSKANPSEAPIGINQDYL